MTLSFLLKGSAIGFSIAAPVGPIGLLCIRRSLAEGRQMGLATGLGAASADAGYGCVAGFGLTAVSSFLIGQRFWLGLFGGLFLCYLGARTFLSKPQQIILSGFSPEFVLPALAGASVLQSGKAQADPALAESHSSVLRPGP